MPTGESEVDASEWHKVPGSIGQSFSSQVVLAYSQRKLYSSSATRQFGSGMHERESRLNPGRECLNGMRAARNGCDATASELINGGKGAVGLEIHNQADHIR